VAWWQTGSFVSRPESLLGLPAGGGYARFLLSTGRGHFTDSLSVRSLGGVMVGAVWQSEPVGIPQLTLEASVADGGGAVQYLF